MQPSEVNRRDVLQLLAVFIASSAVSQRVWGGTSVRAELADGLDTAALKELGREYLTAFPNDRDVRSVAMLLDADSSEPSALMKLRRMMHADYEAARVVNLAGWYVSVTEARLLAAFSG
jgi:lipopolysaccharide biosynthesis regulator YciM